MEERKYARLSDLVDATFTVEKVWGYDWKMWDNQNNKMLRSDKWEKGYSKKWQVVTDKGQIDFGTGQFSNLLEQAYNTKEDMASLVGKTYHVKSNGKSGMEIRYYLNLVRQPEQKETVINDEDVDKPVDLSDVPF